jgi:cGMP-dependent protein kinase
MGGFIESAAMFYVGCIALALGHMHRMGVAYRDLKPENTLIDQHGYCKLIDFGFAKKIPGPEGNLSYTVCGSPEYVAPEIILSKGHDRTVDLWALGILAYELMVGHTPFAHESRSVVFKQIIASDKFLGSASMWPRGFKPEAKAFVKGLVASKPTSRKGAGKSGIAEIQNMDWFTKNGFDWSALLAKKLVAPLVPLIKDPLDASNFDVTATDDEEDTQPYTGSQELYAKWSDGFVSFPPMV